MVKSNNYEPRANNTFVLSPTKFRFKLAEDLNQRLKTLIYRAGIRLFAWCLKLPPKFLWHPASSEIRVILKWLNTGSTPIIFDIGANNGEHSKLYHEAFGCPVFAFEADPCVMEELKSQVSEIVGIKCFEVACSDKNGTTEFHPSSFQNSNSNGASGSLLIPTGHKKHFQEIKFRSPISVTCIRLDDWIQNEIVPSPDFIHMDVQGAELMVLEGMGRHLETTSLIWLEVENLTMYDGQPLKKDVELFFSDRGWQKKVDTTNRALTHGDQLWFNPRARGGQISRFMELEIHASNFLTRRMNQTR